jgi:hypothetical protein
MASQLFATRNRIVYRAYYGIPRNSQPTSDDIYEVELVRLRANELANLRQ